MARAPRPGSTPNAKKEAARKLGYRITVRGEAAEVYLADIGPRDDAMVRRETNKPAALGYKVSLMGSIQQLADGEQVGMDTVCTLWWFGRVKSGDTTESLAEALDRFPPLGEMDDACDIGAIEDDADGEGEETDPLPSDGD